MCLNLDAALLAAAVALFDCIASENDIGLSDDESLVETPLAPVCAPEPAEVPVANGLSLPLFAILPLAPPGELGVLEGLPAGAESPSSPPSSDLPLFCSLSPPLLGSATPGIEALLPEPSLSFPPSPPPGVPSPPGLFPPPSENPVAALAALPVAPASEEPAEPAYASAPISVSYTHLRAHETL